MAVKAFTGLECNPCMNAYLYPPFVVRDIVAFLSGNVNKILTDCQEL